MGSSDSSGHMTDLRFESRTHPQSHDFKVPSSWRGELVFKTEEVAVGKFERNPGSINLPQIVPNLENSYTSRNVGVPLFT